MKVAISTSTFAQENEAPLQLLSEAGIEVIPNPVGRRWTEDESIRFLDGVDGLISGLEPLSRRVLDSTQGRLRAIARVGIGLENIDMEAARELGIRVSNTPDAPTEAVAELTVGALLAMVRNLGPMNKAMHEGRWNKIISRGLRELTVLVVGFGRIGRKVADLLAAMGSTVLIVDPHLPDGEFSIYRRTDLIDGLRIADVVTLHASGDRAIISDAEFAAAKPGLILLNSARAGLVDEDSMIRAVAEGRVAQAWFDTFWREPYSGPLVQSPQVLLTPHVSTYTRGCRLRMETESVRNLLRDLGSVDGRISR